MTLADRYLAMLYEAIAEMNTKRCPNCDGTTVAWNTSSNTHQRLQCRGCHRVYFDDDGPLLAANEDPRWRSTCPRCGSFT